MKMQITITMNGTNVSDALTDQWKPENIPSLAKQRSLEKLLDKAHQESRICPLTGIGNRRAFDDDIASVYANLLRASYAVRNKDNEPERLVDDVAIIALDLNKFKAINDTLGHPGGDKALKFVVSELQRILPRDTDTLYRTGGDEFFIIAEQTNEDGARFLIERIRNLFDSCVFECRGQQFPIGTSAGLQMMDILLDPAKNVNEADVDLYRDKDNGTGKTSRGGHRRFVQFTLDL